ncbi:MAG: helix-turn-helix domain-containing protein, partial [Alicyclobacillus sp.]|nr:helix-turn-helix domain-containing protein [Alicyclobacillus sp.]
LDPFLVVVGGSLGHRAPGPAAATREVAKPGILFGYSQPFADPLQTANAFAEAYFAACLAARLRPGQACASIRDAQVHWVLRPLTATSQAKQLVATWLQPVQAYDRQHHTDLLKTLFVYIQHNGNRSEAADALFIHRTTLQYRLARIESLVGHTLDDADVRWLIRLAFYLHDLTVCYGTNDSRNHSGLTS